MHGLLGATTDPKGTSTDVFKGFPLKVYGKTGTAERPGQADQSWYAAYVPAPDAPDRRRGDDREGRLRRRERGTHGAADPSKWFDVGDREFKVGSSQTR